MNLKKAQQEFVTKSINHHWMLKKKEDDKAKIKRAAMWVAGVVIGAILTLIVTDLYTHIKA
jgi:hypothetical protein